MNFLTKGNFTRDKWNHCLRLFIIMNLSMFSCSHFRAIEKNPKTMSMRSMQGRKTRRRSRRSSLVSKSVNRSPMLDSGESYSPGFMDCTVGIRILQASRNSKCERCERKLSIQFSSVALNWKHPSKHREIDCENPNSTHRDKVDLSQLWDLQYTILWERLRECRTKVESSGSRQNAGSRSWWIFMSATLKAAVHLGLDYEKTFITKNTDLEQFKTLFDITKQLILEKKHAIKTNGMLLLGEDPRNKAVESSKGTRLLSFRALSGQDASTAIGRWLVERTSWIFPKL